MRAAKMRVARRSGGKVAGAKSEDGTPKKKPRFEPITAEGAAGKPRLDRPMRKRADGGRTTISEDSKREARRLRDEGVGEIAAGAVKGAPGAALMGAGLGGYRGHMRSIRPPGAVGKAVWGAMTAAGAGLAGDAAVRHGVRAGNALDEAERIERGEATPGQEDRKHGGRVKKG
jgi:hypothetical protein